MSTAALAWEQFRFERKLFWRNPTAAFFNFVLPLILLLLVATVFASESDELDIADPRRGRDERDGHHVHRAGLRALPREQGILKRVRGTPLPAASYFGGMSPRRCPTRSSRCCWWS